MRILFCNYEYPPLGGGGGVVNAVLAEELAARHECVVLTSRGPGLPSESLVNGVRILRAPVFFRRQVAAANLPSLLAYLPMGTLRGRRLLREESFDIINTHFALPSGPVGNSLSRSFNIPNVLSVHGGDLYDPSKGSSPHRHWVLRKWVRYLLGSADAVVSQSENTLNNVTRYFRSDLDVKKIPLGIRRPPAIEADRSEFGLRPDDIVLVTVGRLVARKQVDELLHGIHSLGRANVRLIVIGSGPEQEPLNRLCETLNISEAVRFMGQVSDEDKDKLMKLSDIYVSTSQHEGFGLVFLEAMSAGLPVVCYDHGGQTDFLESGVTGYLVPLDDRAQFEKSCAQLIDSADLREEMATQNQERVVNYYSDQCASAYEALFDEVLRARSAS